MAIEGGRISKKDKDLIAESRAYKAAAQRKVQRSAHAQWRGDALQAVGLKEDGKMRRQVERRAAAQAKNRKARLKNARQRAEERPDARTGGESGTSDNGESEAEGTSEVGGDTTEDDEREAASGGAHGGTA
jgi:hypothetical protein